MHEKINASYDKKESFKKVKLLQQYSFAFSFVGVLALLLLALSIPLGAFAEETNSAALPQVSAQGDSARIEGCEFAVEEFSRAQIGSNRLIDNNYYGYLYYVSDKLGAVSLIATEDYLVVYLPTTQVSELVFDSNNKDDIEKLKQMLVALDKVASQGSLQLSDISDWYFTSEKEFSKDGIVFFFDRELRDGQVFSGVIGEDGSDVTASDGGNSPYLKPNFFDKALLSKADEVVVEPAKTGLDAFGEFLGAIDYGPLWVTLRTTGLAIVFIFILGLAAAYFSLWIPKRVQDVVDSIFTIPMVLPPTVCGFLLMLALGKNTVFGQWFIDSGFPLVFSWQATVIAAIVVAFPLMYRSARGAFEGLDANMLDAARTLGWSNARIFFRLMLPLSWSSIAAGTVLAFARALGEFGATLFLAGNYAGITRTVPIAIYFEWMNGRTDVAIFWTMIIIVISFIVILLINVWGRKTTKYKRKVEE